MLPAPSLRLHLLEGEWNILWEGYSTTLLVLNYRILSANQNMSEANDFNEA